MNIMDQFQEIGEGMLLAQEGKVLIARAIADKISAFFSAISLRLTKLAARSPTIEGWHP